MHTPPDTQLHFDQHYARVSQAVALLLARGEVVAPLDVLLVLEVITPEQVELWRKGGLPYLERGMTVGLARVGRMLRVLHAHALELGLTPTQGKYLRRGKGAKGRLRFSKSGSPDSEALYSCHFVRRPAPGPTKPQPSEPLTSEASQSALDDEG